jgi:deoxyribonuclease V
MKSRDWMVSDQVDAAIEEQLKVRERLILQRTLKEQEICSIGGADAAYTDGEVIAAVVVLTYPGGKELASAVAVARDPFPYIPGLFAFREGKAVLSAFQVLGSLPDIIFFHGHGIAHPRRCGLASHLGVLLDLPSIGVANQPLLGTTGPLGPKRGDTAPLIENEEEIGMAVRTKERARPVYVSVGHKTDLPQAVNLVLATTGKYRMPEPLRRADQMARAHRTTLSHQR